MAAEGSGKHRQRESLGIKRLKIEKNWLVDTWGLERKAGSSGHRVGRESSSVEANLKTSGPRGGKRSAGMESASRHSKKSGGQGLGNTSKQGTATSRVK